MHLDTALEPARTSSSRHRDDLRTSDNFLRRLSFETGGLATPPGGSTRWVVIPTATDECILAILECPRQGACTGAGADRMVDRLVSAVRRGMTAPDELQRILNPAAFGEGIRVASTIVFCHGCRLIFSAAGSRGPMIVGGRARQLSVEGPLLGYCENPRFECGEHTLDPHEWAVMTSRGVADATNAGGEFFSAATNFPRVLDHGISVAGNLTRCLDQLLRHCCDGKPGDIAIGLIRGRATPLSIESGLVTSPALAAHAHKDCGVSGYAAFLPGTTAKSRAAD